MNWIDFSRFVCAGIVVVSVVSAFFTPNFDQSGDEEQHFSFYPWRVFWVTFVALLLVNATTLFAPPYWDSCVGVFRQGVWLAEHNLNYFELAEQSRYMTGPNLNIMLIFALEIAVLLKLFSAPWVFFILHVQNLAFVAGMVVAALRILQRYTSWTVACLWILCALIQPIFSGQMGEIYLEIPVAFFGIWACCFYLEGRFFQCVGMFFLGCLVKSTVFVLALAIFTVQFLRLAYFISYKRKGFAAAIRPGEWRTLLMLLPFVQLLYSSDRQLVRGFAVWWYFAKINFPDLLAVISVVASFLILILIVPKWRGRVSTEASFMPLLLLITWVLGFAASHVLFPNPLPRYWAFVILPLACVAGAAIYRIFGRWPAIVLALLWIAFSALSQHGQLLPKPFIGFSRDGSEMERSREFLLDQQQQLELCQFIENELQGETILVQFPFNLILTKPELGYVTKSCADRIISFDQITDVKVREATTESLKDKNLIFLFVPSKFEKSSLIKFGPTSRSKYIKEWRLPRRSHILLFRNNFIVPRTRRKA